MIKAGGAGSTPDGASNVAILEISQPLHEFLAVVGNAVFNLNSIVVGLDAVAEGYRKPDGLDISWHPEDPGIASRKARKFILESVLVRCSEALLQYVLALARLPRVANSLDWNGDTPAADKIRDIAALKLEGGDYLIPASMLLVHWRNRVVHTNSRAALRHHEKQVLHANEEYIQANYKGLSVDCLLCHFEEGRPTLKDISSLISMTIRMTRSIDERLYSSLNRDDLDAWLEYYGLVAIIKKVETETSPEKRAASVSRAIKSNAPKLLEAYVEHYGQGSAS